MLVGQQTTTSAFGGLAAAASLQDSNKQLQIRLRGASSTANTEAGGEQLFNAGCSTAITTNNTISGVSSGSHSQSQSHQHRRGNGGVSGTQPQSSARGGVSTRA